MALETNPNYPDIRPLRQAMIRRFAKLFYKNVRDNREYAHKVNIDEFTDRELEYVKELLLSYGLSQQENSGAWELAENATQDNRFPATLEEKFESIKSAIISYGDY